MGEKLAEIWSPCLRRKLLLNDPKFGQKFLWVNRRASLSHETDEKGLQRRSQTHDRSVQKWVLFIFYFYLFKKNIFWADAFISLLQHTNNAALLCFS
jgi:hypothetical protein